MIEGSGSRSVPLTDPDPGSPKTYGYGTLVVAIHCSASLEELRISLILFQLELEGEEFHIFRETDIVAKLIN
jgi:hypothetical protein